MRDISEQWGTARLLRRWSGWPEGLCPNGDGEYFLWKGLALYNFTVRGKQSRTWAGKQK
ncbi:uncharacterized protein BO72DRAFT_132139 [Aspergillus fijiensis CBS 313.89]|uniref:Uncharacterized protein n=1 Tax=Aspergillus fijiensis CBS 313.89 TaxID=1448319 RepID=A0A8G1RNC0_9EURO|nr:uncharacterized protein BO72DRAFT_132139 [Aspergillus fijiensis CBS 313.89]RAK76359.1 hypothetical protein BO72DRAFT_132139 [Aspergillus fijiensis CBS 313.89]